MFVGKRKLERLPRQPLPSKQSITMKPWSRIRRRVNGGSGIARLPVGTSLLSIAAATNTNGLGQNSNVQLRVHQWRRRLATKGKWLLLYCVAFVWMCCLSRLTFNSASLLLQFSHIKINFSFSCSPFWHGTRTSGEEKHNFFPYGNFHTHFLWYLMCSLTVLCLSRITCCRVDIRIE